MCNFPFLCSMGNKFIKGNLKCQILFKNLFLVALSFPKFQQL